MSKGELHQPDQVLAMKMQRVLLVMAEHFKHNGLALDVLNEGFCNLYWNLLKQWKKKGFSKCITIKLSKHSLCMRLLIVCVYALTFWTW